MLLLPRNIQALACCAGACLQSFCTWGNFNRRRWGIFNRRKLGNFQPALTTNKYSKIVDRWEQLERLSINDLQLAEASKTFLYGFRRATVVLCASAVETHLKRLVASAPDRAGAFDLIEAAEMAKLIEPDLACYARDLFSYRNRVAHENHDPSHDKAKEVLAVARMLVAKLQVA